MIQKCKNGHWYDADVYPVCPHCKRQGEKLSIRVDNVREDDKTVSLMDMDDSLSEALGSLTGIMPDTNMHTQENYQDNDKTISFGFFDVTEISPVTGWLVCIDGYEKGKDYRLHSGKNFVGRSTTMDVVLIDDKSISRDKHCSITYDPKGNAFYISSEHGNIVYLNNEMVNDTAVLNNGDSINIGDTRLLFVAFCQEGRTWEKE